MANKQVVQTRPGRVKSTDKPADGKARCRSVSLTDDQAANIETKYGSLTKALKSLIK